jgi:hypothetical protein
MMAIQLLETNIGVKNALTRKWRVFIVEQNVEPRVSLLKNRTAPFSLKLPPGNYPQVTLKIGHESHNFFFMY